MGIHESKLSLLSPTLWCIFFLYLLFSGYTIAHHELWGDEIHSWNIAKGSSGYLDLIHNTRYEGHPPVWYTILWTISKFTHNLQWVQAAHWVIASLSVALILFFSRFPLVTKILMPFGYYFLYEYSVLSRNYAIGILLAFCICIIIRKPFRYKIPVYYLLLFLMSNTHLLAILLAGSLHLYFLLYNFEHTKDKRSISLHISLGALIFLPSLYFIFPPSDSQLNVQFWVNRWEMEQLKTLGQAPLRSYVPIPSWWNYHYWNTQFLLDAAHKSKLLNLFVALAPLAISVYVLRGNKKSLVVFLSNLILSFIIAVAVFPLTSGRYAGFIYIGFIVAYWLYCYEEPATRNQQWLVNSLLIIQIIAGVFVAIKDIRRPFSNANKVTELLKTPAPGERVVSDYWAMNTIAAFADRPFYCLELEKDITFVLWGSELGNVLKSKYRYFDGVTHLFQKEGINRLYLVSTASPEMINRADQKVFQEYKVKVVDKKEGAVEKGGNLYLYEISSR
jgi:hypothetical protein